MKSFTISPPPGDPPTLQNNTGKVTFTVTNTATRTVNGTVMAKPTAPAQESWFSFAEGATRNYQPGAVMSVATTITVPAGTAEGTYTFRLDAKAEDNPDEDYTEGPSAQFIVAAAPKPVPWWKRYWWIIAIVAVVLIGIVLAIVLLSGGDDGGGGGGGDGDGDGGPDVVEIPERNCIEYDPRRVSPLPLGEATTISSDGAVLAIVTDRGDVEQALLLAGDHTKRCSISDVEYWLGDGGGRRPDPLDCAAYDPAQVTVTQLGESSFRLDGVPPPAETLTTRQDADDLAAVARAFTRRCFIGRGSRVDPSLDVTRLLERTRGLRGPLGGAVREELLDERLDRFVRGGVDYWE